MSDDLLIQTASLLAATLRQATPLVLAALGGLFCERAGIVDIGLEGKMLGAAFAAGAVAAITGSVWLGLAAAIAVSIAPRPGARLCRDHPSRQPGGLGHGASTSWSPVSPRALPRRGSSRAATRPRSPPPPASTAIDLPFAATLNAAARHRAAHRPADRRPHAAGLSRRNRRAAHRAHPGPAHASASACAAVGENPQAVDTAGISVARLRYQALLCTGLLCGIAGADLSLAQSAGFFRDMTAGRGYLALAALIFGKWRPGADLARLPALRLRRCGADATAGRRPALDRRHPGQFIRPCPIF